MATCSLGPRPTPPELWPREKQTSVPGRLASAPLWPRGQTGHPGPSSCWKVGAGAVVG